TKPGRLPWRVGFVDGGGAPHQASGRLTVKSRTFPVQRLSLPKGMVDLSPDNERRAEVEAARLRTLYDTITSVRFWRGRFTSPIASDVKSDGFGFRRVINGKPRSPHTGVDFAAAAGTPVVASNGGRVALVADHFFGGRLIALAPGGRVSTRSTCISSGSTWRKVRSWSAERSWGRWGARDAPRVRIYTGRRSFAGRASTPTPC